MTENNMQLATFAAGCFWGVEKIFGELPGVLQTRVGYIGGHRPNPSYESICTGTTGHAEAIELEFDPEQISYAALVAFFFMHHDSTTPDRQGNDVGTQYRSAIFYHTDAQRIVAEKAIDILNDAGALDDPVVTEVTAAETFYAAEEYHQKYLQKNPHGYCHVSRQSDQVVAALTEFAKQG